MEKNGHEQVLSGEYSLWVPWAGYNGEDTSWVLKSTSNNLDEFEEGREKRHGENKIKGRGNEELCLIVYPHELRQRDIKLLADESYALIIDTSGCMYEEVDGKIAGVRDHKILLKKNKSELAKEITSYLTERGLDYYADRLRMARNIDLTKIGIRRLLRNFGLEGKLVEM